MISSITSLLEKYIPCYLIIRSIKMQIVHKWRNHGLIALELKTDMIYDSKASNNETLSSYYSKRREVLWD